jgi:hypothetical protein
MILLFCNKNCKSKAIHIKVNVRLRFLSIIIIVDYQAVSLLELEISQIRKTAKAIIGLAKSEMMCKLLVCGTLK